MNLTEMLAKQVLGEEVYCTQGNLFIRPLERVGKPFEVAPGINMYRNLVTGIIFTENPICEGKTGKYQVEQMIEGKVIIVPDKIYADNKGHYAGYRIDQIVTDDWTNPKHYRLLGQANIKEGSNEVHS